MGLDFVDKNGSVRACLHYLGQRLNSYHPSWVEDDLPSNLKVLHLHDMMTNLPH